MNTRESDLQKGSGPSGPQGPDASELIDALFGFNRKVVRTLWHTFTSPTRVVRAALDGGGQSETYVSPLRLFILLFGLQLAITTLFTGAAMPDLEVIGINPNDDRTRAWLGEALTFDTVNGTVRTWGGVLAWPMMVLASLPYMILLKVYAPRWTFYGHVLVYLATTNAVMFLQLVIVLLTAPFVSIELAGFVSTVSMFVVYLFVIGRVIFTVYSASFLGGFFKLFGIIATAPLSLVLIGLLQLLSFELILQLGHGLSLIDLVTLTSEFGVSQ